MYISLGKSLTDVTYTGNDTSGYYRKRQFVNCALTNSTRNVEFDECEFNNCSFIGSTIDNVNMDNNLTVIIDSLVSGTSFKSLFGRMSQLIAVNLALVDNEFDMNCYVRALNMVNAMWEMVEGLSISLVNSLT